MPKSTKLSIRLDLPNGTRFGPGKAALLEEISKNGSISAASKTLGMSYPRALRLVNELNTQFSEPLISKFQGGANRGGATLTALGNQVLVSYHDISKLSATAAASKLRSVSRLSS